MLVKPKYKRTQNMGPGKINVSTINNNNGNKFHTFSEAGTSRDSESLKRKSRKDSTHQENHQKTLSDGGRASSYSP